MPMSTSSACSPPLLLVLDLGVQKTAGVQKTVGSRGRAVAQVAVLGTGKKTLEAQVKTLQKDFPGVAGVVKFSSPLAHLITAGACMVPYLELMQLHGAEEDRIFQQSCSCQAQVRCISSSQ